MENVGFPDNQPSISSQSQSRSLPHSALSSHTPRTGPVSSRTLCNYMHFEMCDILLVLVVKFTAGIILAQNILRKYLTEPKMIRNYEFSARNFSKILNKMRFFSH